MRLRGVLQMTTDNSRRQTPESKTTLAPTLCVGGPVIMDIAHEHFMTTIHTYLLAGTSRAPDENCRVLVEQF